MAGPASDLTPFEALLLVAAGSAQADATGISAKWSPGLIVAAGNDVKGLRLPPATKGKSFVVKNIGTAGITSTLKVYPATGGQINELGTNNPIVMGQKTSTTFIALSTTQWYTSPTVRS